MRIELRDAGKRYRREWILRHIDLTLEPGGRYAVSGPNGSGKSTLLKLLSGHLTPSRGQVAFSYAGQPLAVADVYARLSFAAPYIELIEEFTLHEAIRFHQRFRPLLPGLDADALTAVLGLQKSRNLPVSSFSSGMKQRLKIALACCTTSDYILLDEPTTNLDTQGMEWYQRILAQYVGDRLLVIASNVADDYRICGAEIDILRYK
jgi:ABC-type multidrug transport system ATPase subunit